MEKEILRVLRKMQILDILVNNNLVVAQDNPNHDILFLTNHILNFILTNHIWPAQN